MKEYRIVVTPKSGKKYSLWTFKDFFSCYLQLTEMIIDKKTHVRPQYYVTNEFYKNEYPMNYPDITLYTIEVRDVDDWKEYNKKEEKESNNIIPLKKIAHN